MKVHFAQLDVIELLPNKHILARHMCLHIRPDLDPRRLWNNLGVSLNRGGEIDIILFGRCVGHIEPLGDNEMNAFEQSLAYMNTYPKWCFDILSARDQASALATRAANEAIKAEIDKQHRHYLDELPWQAKCLTMAAFIGAAAYACSMLIP